MTTNDILSLAATAHDIHGYAKLDEHGDHYSCGGAWVVIPARGKFAKEAKATWHFLFPHHSGGFALRFGSIPAQSEWINAAACQAAADILKAYGIEARVHSYVD